jgi:sentrin-specific protease 1
MHWTSAAINFRQKRIEAYDSMSMNQGDVYKVSGHGVVMSPASLIRAHQQLRLYIDAEHRNKKKEPFDFTGWKDYTHPVEWTTAPQLRLMY